MDWLLSTPVFIGVGSLLFFLGLLALSGIRYVSNTRVGIVEKLWAKKGSLEDGAIIALNGEAGYQGRILRGGLHFRLWRWQYAVHKVPLVTIRQNKLGYVFARDGKPLPPNQSLGQVVDCNFFQDADSFLTKQGQRGRQRGILREGVYAINLALFNVITEDEIYCLGYDKKLEHWQSQLEAADGFNPVVIGRTEGDPTDDVGIITTHDGPPLQEGQIIAPHVQDENNYQDIEAFLEAGGRRGLQYTPIIDGTYYINRWFATVERIPKQVVPIGHVGVVVSYYGKDGQDVSGLDFRHGERVGDDERGVRAKPLGPGKYAFNTYAGEIILVPTTNFVLHWVTGKTEGHRYDDNLTSIELVTRDAYEPVLPLSVVVHIDYQNAPSVIQRFGDVKQLITQTLDPLLSAYFRDVAHKKSMLELIHERDDIQSQARNTLGDKFQMFDIKCVDVLIGKPDPAQDDDGRIENLLEQLRQRQLSQEQMETYAKQQEAAEKEITLNAARAKAAQQEELTRSKIAIEITANKASAQLEQAKKEAEQKVVTAEADKRSTVLEAEGRSEGLRLMGQGEAAKTQAIGDAEAAVLRLKVESFGDPNLFALQSIADSLSKSEQPLVPSSLFGSNGQSSNVLEMLVNMVTMEKAQGLIQAKPKSEPEPIPAPPADVLDEDLLDEEDGDGDGDTPM